MSSTGPRSPAAEQRLEDILHIISSEGPRDRLEPLRAFASAYLRRMPAGGASQLTPHELYVQIESLYEFASTRGDAPMAVRVFDPRTLEKPYPSHGTVVEIVIDDMPFLIDSVTGEVQAHGYNTELINHPVIGAQRDEDGRLVRVRHARHTDHRESIQHIELDRFLDEAETASLEDAVARVLTDVQRAVRDFLPMQEAVDRLITLARSGSSRYEDDEIQETVGFFEWLRDLNFVFLGYREYEMVDSDRGRAVRVVPKSGLGILSDESRSGFSEPVPLAEMSDALRERFEGGDLVVITKTNRTSTVHRRAKMDYIGVRHIAPDGEVLGEGRLVGLFTSRAYMTPAGSIPLLRRKLERILDAEDLIEGSHDHKLVIQLFDSFPKDELFATPTEEIRRSIVGLLEHEEHQHVRLFVRPDLLQRSVSILVVLPRDLFNADLRRALQQLFVDAYGGASVDYRLSLGEAAAARIHFTIWIEGGHVPDVPFDRLEAEVLALCRSWKDRLADLLATRFSQTVALDLVDRWADRFPAYYTSSTSLDIAAGDIARLDELDPETNRLEIGIQNEPEGAHGGGDRLTRLAVYRLDGKLDLSVMMPSIESFGLRVVEEVPTRLGGDEAGTGDTFIHDFGVSTRDGELLDLEACGQRLAESLRAVLLGATESDSLHRLVVTTPLTFGEIDILRAYRTYWRLVSPSFTATYMNDALAAHPTLATRLVRLFQERFDPERDGSNAEALEQAILEDLDTVTSLDYDRIIRGFLGLIKATVRTNVFKPNRTSSSFKLRSADVPEMPRPFPLFEIFVFAPEVEGVHLRGGMVARGGIRWSDRREDYRTEVLGLMKAQVTKNSIIVPTGSKGGFIVRRPPADRAGLAAEVTRAYTTFISGLLDLTDNLVSGRPVSPRGVKVHDDPDPYLVVAADKGTARLSDTANDVASSYGFWLGDAFASGGSAGYDHKALGITAKGAWESVRRHFREIGIDDQQDDFTVVGIGDMSGDVFGNGMLRSPHIKLLAAFDHRHIFLDPDPDPASSFAERSRMFTLAGSSWEEYDRSLISAGGGVYPRSAKRIDISDQARSALSIDAGSLTPSELISAILRAPVDLLWNGGIGTYVKASTESNDLVGDRSNDSLRVDGKQLRCRVVGEGGNLGFTQLGRIEFAKSGGRIFTDFIDNAGGVHCSDREVNIKILINLAVERGLIDGAERDELVRCVADDVVDRVVYENYLQAQILSQASAKSGQRLEAYEDLMEMLEADGMLDREIEKLPSQEDMVERIRNRQPMRQPELAVLLAYAKRRLSDELLASPLPDWEYFLDDLRAYFPDAIRQRLDELIPEHALRRELVATIITNEIVDSEGVTFVSRLELELGVSAPDVVRAYRIARGITDAGTRWRAVEELDGVVEPALQRKLMEGVDALVEATARWYLGRRSDEWIQHAVAAARTKYESLSSEIATIGPQEWRSERDAKVEELLMAGVPHDIAQRHVYQKELFLAPDILDVSGVTDRSIVDVARVFFLVGQQFKLDWLGNLVESLPAVNRWQRLSIQALTDDLTTLRRRIAEGVLLEGRNLPPDIAVGAYLDGRPNAEDRIARLTRSLKRDGSSDPSALIVAIRQLRTLAG